MILVLSSDGIREFSLVRDITGVPVHVDGFVPVAQEGGGAVLGGVVFIQIGCRGQVMQLVAHQAQAVTEQW